MVWQESASSQHDPRHLHGPVPTAHLHAALCAIVAAEVTYSVLTHDLNFWAGTRRFLTQLAAGEFAFLLGILLRPRSGRAWE
jgi:hypothetical protein